MAEAEGRRITMVMKQLGAPKLGPPTPMLADMAEQLRRFIAWHARECKPRVDALVTKSTQLLDAFMKEQVEKVRTLMSEALTPEELETGATDAVEEDGWASPFPRTKRPPAPCQVAMGAGQCPLGGAALPH